MTHIDRCEFFIAIFIAAFIVPFDGNHLKPNRGKGLSPFMFPTDFSICYENCENSVSNGNSFVEKIREIR